MHGAEARVLEMVRMTADALSADARRDLVAYWGRRKFEARPQDWT
jgi:hypothetical protein